MMWFRRPEFDRYARFKSHGSAREIFDWEEMCNTLLPIPHPDKQREIVKEYNVIQNRIALNQQLIQKLEETAQAIYREWFVEFWDLLIWRICLKNVEVREKDILFNITGVSVARCCMIPS
jgi:restriction endonuclease S subunit